MFWNWNKKELEYFVYKNKDKMNVQLLLNLCSFILVLKPKLKTKFEIYLYK